MKKILLILLAVVFVIFAIIGFMLYKSFDEDNYKAQVIASTKELMGRDMIVNGQFSLDVFPAPIIKISDVVIKNTDTFGQSDFVKIKSIEAHIQFKSLFKNPLIVDNIILNEPEIFLARNEKGENNWDFNFLKQKDDSILQDNKIGQTYSEAPPQFQNIELKDAKITYSNALTKESFSINSINGKMNSTSITGPFDFVGKITFDKMNLDTTLHVDKIIPTSQTKFNVSLSNPDSSTTFSIQNGLLKDVGMPLQTISAGFLFNIPKLSSFLANYKGYKDLPETLNKEFNGTGQISLSAKEISLTDLAFRFGQDNVENAMAAKVTILQPTKEGEKSKTSALVRFLKLNLDTFIPYLPKGHSWQNILGYTRNFLPENLDLVLEAQQLQLNADTASNLVLSFDINDGKAHIREFKAALPEETKLEINGDISLKATEPEIQIDYSLETTTLEKTLKWLKLNEKLSLNLSPIKEFKTSGRMRLRPKDLTFSKMSSKINSGKIEGGMVFSLTEKNLNGFANLTAKDINVDDFIPYTQTKEARSVGQFVAGIKNALESSSIFGENNFALQLSAQNVTFKNLPMQQVTYDGQIEDGVWTTDKLEISQVAMSNISYKGTIQKQPDSSLYLNDVQISLEMPKSLLLLDRLNITSPIPGNITKVNLDTKISGTFDKLNTTTELALSQGKINLSGSVENFFKTNPSYALQIKITHPNFQQFMRLFNPSFKSLPALSGNFSFNGLISHKENLTTAKGTQVAVGPQKMSADLNFTKDDDLLTINGEVTSSYLYLDKFLASQNIMGGNDAKTGKSEFSRKLLDLNWMENLSLDVKLTAPKMAFGKVEMDQLETKIILNDKILTMENISASIDEKSVKLSLLLNNSTATPFIKGSVKLNDVPVRPDLITMGLFRLKNGNITLSSDFDTKGNSIEDMINELAATGRYEIQNGGISSLNLPAFEHRIRASLARQENLSEMKKQLNKELTLGETAFNSLKGTFVITKGVFRTSDTTLYTKDASAIMQINFDMPEWNINASNAITLNSFTGYPPISIAIKGAAHNPQTNIDFASFIKYVEATSSDAKARLQKEEDAAKAMQARIEAKDRIVALKEMLTQAEKDISKTEQVIQMTDLPSAQTDFVRAKDALALLRELARKTTPSEADLEKALNQSALITSRTQAILENVSQKTITALRSEINSVEVTSQETMHAVHRIWKRLNTVEQIDQAYQKAFSTMSLIQQLNTFAKESTDIENLKRALSQIKEASDILDLAYESIAKFDVENAAQTSQTETEAFGGMIRRN